VNLHRWIAHCHATDQPDSRGDDLDAYLAIADEIGACRALDIGCGTGTLALLLADRGLQVNRRRPGRWSLSVARAKPGATRVRGSTVTRRLCPCCKSISRR
jgi:2-polyprenyl-3-methyl-5-hydroxy-6-metoxy-1,4-benzoquinol methylase